MIRDLALENFLFIPSGDLVFGPGLNVITGETGAGKSIMLEAVKLLLGKKAKATLVAPGAATARIQASFSLDDSPGAIAFLKEAGFVDEDEPSRLVISRTFPAQGSGRILVNGLLATTGLLRDLGNHLMEIHGQNEHQTLLKPEIQRNLLDRTGGEPHLQSVAACRTKYAERKRLEQELESLEQNLARSVERCQELEEMLQGLKTLQLTDPQEQETLKAEIDRLAHAEHIAQAIQTAASHLNGSDDLPGAVMRIFQAKEALRKAAAFDVRLNKPCETLETMYHELSELAGFIDSLGDDMSYDPERIAFLNARLADLSRACRRHGTDVPGLFDLMERINQELDMLSAPDSTRGRLQHQLNMVTREHQELLATVSQHRETLAANLGQAVSKEMIDLGFGAARFSISLIPQQPTADGAESVEFIVALNPGHPGGPLRRIASGGELSRVALAVKKVLARHDLLPTLLFDEIDTGIGGTVGEAVARSLHCLGQEKQVLVVTHLHQIAKEGTTHFSVTKMVEKGTTTVDIQALDQSQREAEIARMLGQTGKEGKEFARRILSGAQRNGSETPLKAKARGKR